MSKKVKRMYSDYTFTYFKKINDPMSIIRDAISIDELDVLIRNDKMKTKIEAIRKEKDTQTKGKLKEQLPLVTFSGVFKKRGKQNLIKHSKLICLDIDKIPQALELKDDLKKVGFIHYMFISPSGNGLKIIIQIDATNEEEHKKYFLALEKYFKEVLKVEVDNACKDVSRACFLSYDPFPFWDLESDILDSEWLKEYFPIENKKIEKLEVKSEGSKNKKEIIKGAVQRFLEAKDGSKHEVLLKQSIYLGYHINAGILDFTTCFNALKSAVEQRKDELTSVQQAIITIEKGLYFGIENPKPIKYYKISTKDYQFWYAFKGNLSIKITSYYTFLNRNGFWGYSYNKNRKLIRVQNNIVSIIEKKDIIDFTMDYIRKLDHDIGDSCTRKDLLDSFHNKLNHLVSENQLTTFLRLEKQFLCDGAGYSYLFYKNGILKITKDEKLLLDYKDLKGLIWKTSIIDRDYKPTTLQNLNYLSEGEFVQFIKGVTGDRENDKQFSRYESMKTILGYLLHEYKDPKNPTAIVFCDEEVSDNPNGGTGKGIILKALQYFKKITVIDGRNFSFHKTFAFQQVDIDTKILAFDDIQMKFNFINLFSIISEGIAVEKKNKDTLYLKYEDAPKLLLTTNYMVTGEGNSYKRRKIEIEFSQHYNGKHTPFDEFSKTLYDDWDNEQWQYFDLFMTDCIQLFLKNEIIMPTIKNIPLRKLRQETSEEFAKFAHTKLVQLQTDGKEYPVKSIKEKFFIDYPHFRMHNWFTSNRLNKWMKLYGDLFGYEIQYRFSNNIQYISFTKKI